MSRLRWSLALGLLAISALLGYALRDMVYQLVVVPIAYALWVINFYYSAIPQWIVWTVLLAMLFIVVLWRMIPDVRLPRSAAPARERPAGDVEALAVWIGRVHEGTYFKWQLANRLGRMERRIKELTGGKAVAGSDPLVQGYLDAGLNYSFVDFPAPRSPLERPGPTPLDVDPGRVISYLESQMENSSERRR